MIKLLPLLFIFTSCAVSSAQGVTSLSPLPTTGIISNVQPDYGISQEELDQILSDLADEHFISDVEHWYGELFIPIPNDTMIDFGHMWCIAFQDGMTALDVQSRIDEGAVDQRDADLHFAIVRSALFNYCPEQQYKWESS